MDDMDSMDDMDGGGTAMPSIAGRAPVASGLVLLAAGAIWRIVTDSPND